MTGRPLGEEEEELERFLEEVRRPAAAIVTRYGISLQRATDILSDCLVLVTEADAEWDERRRQFLAAVENACRELRAKLGPPEEEHEDEPPVH